MGLLRVGGTDRPVAGSGPAGAGAAGRLRARRRGDGLRSAVRPAAALLALLALGCGGLQPPPLRPEPVAHLDTLPIEEPEARDPALVAVRWERAFMEELEQAADAHEWVGAHREALNVTRFDGVVSSAWFEHRNGRRPLSPAEIRAGAAAAPGPDTSRPLTVVRGKVSGAMPGFTVEDARGDRYLVKFDPEGYPGLATNPEVITSRLFHAAGYHVPANYVVTFEPGDLVLAGDAVFDYGGATRPMTRRDLQRILERVEPSPDGRIRTLASRFVEGVPKGPFFFEGRRKDDPNDHYLHEYRRELRGVWVLAAWLNHSDLIFQNTLDVWIDPPGYLRHYLIDFSSSLGSSQVAPHNPREAYEYELDLGAAVTRMLTLGFHRVGWEGRTWETIHPSVGALPAEEFEPGEWTPNWPTAAWRLLTPADGYWGAKLVAAFSDRQIRAAVSAGDLDPPQADTLADILSVRRDLTVAHWYGKVTPIEEPAVEAAASGPSTPSAPSAASAPSAGSGFRLSFRDLGLEEGVGSPGGTVYRWRFRHPALDRRAEGRGDAGSGPRQSLLVEVGPPDAGSGVEADGLSARERLARLEVTARRGDRAGRPATVFLRWEGPEAGYRVVGLRH